MRYTRIFAGLALTAGMLLPGALSAQDMRYDYRDLNHDYNRVDRLRADMAADRARMNEDLRCGRQGAAAREARDLARDQRRLDSQLRDIRHDRRDIRDDYWRR